MVKALSRVLPVCVFGDPLQAIFDFKGQQPVDWQAHVFPVFGKAGELKHPWRWKDNTQLANWLREMREGLEQGGEIDLSTAPSCVKWEVLPTDPKFKSAKITEICKRARGTAEDDTLVVIADAANIGARAYIAKQLAKAGFSQIEPMACSTLYDATKKFEKETGLNQVVAVMAFISDCMSGTGKTPFLEAVEARRRGSTKGTAKFGRLVDLGVALLNDPTPSTRLALLEGFHARSGTYCFRREMYHAMRAALLLCISRPSCTLTDAIWEIQSKSRHAGRIVSKLCVGSTLLVKGLEFEHAVVIHNPKMTRKDWYVAITRASHGLTLLVPAQRFRLAPEPT
jgi:DNA helicase-2/ATP-dependent DNA helicase PcrA